MVTVLLFIRLSEGFVSCMRRNLSMKLKLGSLIGLLVLATLRITASTSDSLRIEELGRKSLQTVYSQPDTARKLVNEALMLCSKKENDGLAGLTYNYLGIYFDVIGNNDSAFWAYQVAVDYAIAQGNRKTEAASYNNIGLLYWNQSKLAKALEYFFKASEIYDELKNVKGVANTYSNIALVFEDQRRPNEALMYTRLALKIRQEIKDTVNLGRSYSNLGMLLAELGDRDSGIYYHQLSIPFFVKNNNHYSLGASYQNLATNYELLNQYDSALMYAQRALEVRKKIGNKKYLAATYNLLGNIYYYSKLYPQSEESYKATEAIYVEQDNQGELWKLYGRMANLYVDWNRFESATNYLKQRMAITDTLHSKEKVEKLYEIEEKYETEKTNRKLAEANAELILKKNQSQMLIFGLILAGLLALAIYLYLSNRMRKNKEAKHRELLTQKLEISRELHDNIGSQLTYLNLKLKQIEKKQGGSDDLSEIKEFGQRAMTDLRGAIWGLSKELTAGELNLKIANEIQKVQGKERQIEYTTEVNDHQVIDAISAVNILRILQEALQNAIKHSNATLIRVELVVGNVIGLTVSDNGIGIQDTNTGFGMVFMEQRAEKMKGQLNVSSNEKGTTVQLTK